MSMKLRTPQRYHLSNSGLFFKGESIAEHALAAYNLKQQHPARHRPICQVVCSYIFEYDAKFWAKAA